MVHLLEDERQAIAALCERHAVARMDVFGSALRDDMPRSPLACLADIAAVNLRGTHHTVLVSVFTGLAAS